MKHVPDSKEKIKQLKDAIEEIYRDLQKAGVAILASGHLHIGTWNHKALYWSLGNDVGFAVLHSNANFAWACGEFLGSSSRDKTLAQTPGMFKLTLVRHASQGISITRGGSHNIPLPIPNPILSNAAQSVVLELYDDKGALIYTHLGTGFEWGLPSDVYVGKWV